MLFEAMGLDGISRTKEIKIGGPGASGASQDSELLEEKHPKMLILSCQ